MPRNGTSLIEPAIIGRPSARATDVERLLHYVFKLPDAPGCWLWIGGVGDTGYGKIYLKGKVVGAHRAAWMLIVGDIGGLSVLHRCDNTLCVNPEHLFLGTQRDNAQDMSRKRRSLAQSRPERLARGERHGSKTRPESILSGDSHPSSKLNSQLVASIRRRLAAGEKQIHIASELGVDHTTISLISRNRIWRSAL